MTEKSAREQFLDDIITTAVEGGIGYWSQVTAYSWGDDKETTVRVHTLDSAGNVDDVVGVPITRSKIEESIAKIINTDIEIPYVSTPTRGEIYMASLYNDSGDIDATIADIIVQVAMFGEVIFG